MSLVENLSIIRDKIKSLMLVEAKGHLDHPEDLIFLKGVTGANQAVAAIEDTVKNPKSITIKWDGYPALIFGRGVNGKFTIMDKHMFNKKDGSGRNVYSPEQFAQYDQQRGVNRSELHQLIATIWSGLEKADSSKGFYWGDLLFSKPLQEKNGVYSFKANPKGISYTVDVNSEIGQLLSGKDAGIVVHQFIPPNAYTTDDAISLNGTIGKLKNNSNVVIVPSAMPITPKLKIDKQLLNQAKKDIKLYGQSVEQLMSTAPQARNTFNQLFTTYINKRIVSGDLSNLLDGFKEYVDSKPMTVPMKAKISKHLADNQQGLVGVFTIWISLYNLKMNLVEQLNQAAKSSPVKGFLQDGTETQEGFVSQGLKFVDRLGFSRQNLAGR